MGGPPEMNAAALQQEVAAFNAQRGWATVHTVESLCVAVSVESGEPPGGHPVAEGWAGLSRRFALRDGRCRHLFAVAR